MPVNVASVWTGGAGNGAWNDPSNWTNGVPQPESQPGDTLATIDNSIDTADFTVSIFDRETAGDVVVDATNTTAAASLLLVGTLDLSASLGATGTLTLQSGVFEVYGGTLANATLAEAGGSLVIGGSDNFDGVTEQGFFATGQGSTLNISGGVSTFAADAYDTPGYFVIGDDGFLKVFSTLDLSGTVSDNGDATALAVVSSGVVSGGTLVIAVQIQDSGTLDGVTVLGNIALNTPTTRLVETGTGAIGSVSDTAQRTVDLGGGFLEIDGSLSLFHTTIKNGTVALGAGGTLTLDASSDDSGVTFASPVSTAWTGAANDGLWSTAANWTNGVPRPSGAYAAAHQDVALLDNSQIPGRYNVTIAGNQSVQELTISGTSAATAPQVKLTGDLFMEWQQTGGGGQFGQLDLDAGTLQLAGGTLQLALVTIAGGRLTFATGTTSTLDANLIRGNFDVVAGATAVIAPLSFDGVTGTISVEGTLAVKGGLSLSGLLTIGTGGVVLLGGPLNPDIGGDISATTTLSVNAGRVEVTTDAALLNTIEIDGSLSVDAGATLTIGTGASVTLVAPYSDTAITLGTGASLSVLGTLTTDGTIEFASGTLSLDGGTLMGGSFTGGSVAVSTTSTIDGTSILGAITLLNNATLAVLDDVTIGETLDHQKTTLDLGGGTLDVTGTLTLADVAVINGTVVVEAGGTITGDPFSSVHGTPFAHVLTTGSLLSGQNVTLTGFSVELASGGGLSVLTGVNSDGSASGTPGLFTIAQDAAIFGAGLVLVTDAQGPSNTEIDNLVIANVAGQSLHLQTANWTGGGFDAVDGGTLEVGDTTATTTTGAGGFLSGTFTVGTGSTIQLDTAAPITQLIGSLTYDGAGGRLVSSSGGQLTDIQQRLTEIGGPRPGFPYYSYYGSVVLLDGANFTAAQSLDLFGAITIEGGTFTAPHITSLFPNGGIGPLYSSFITGTGTLAAAVDNTYSEIIATGGTLTLTQTITGGSVIADAYSRLIMKQAPTQYQGLILFQSGTLELDGSADGAQVTFDGPGIGVGNVGTASTLEILNPLSDTLTIQGTLDGNVIHLDNFQAIVTQDGLSIAYTSPTTEQIILGSTTGQRVTLNVGGDIAKTGITYAMDAAGTGALLTFTQDPKDAKPVISPGTAESVTSDLNYTFTDNVHIAGLTGSNPSDTLSIANVPSGNQDQGALSGTLLGVSGKAGASGHFADLQPGNSTDDLGVNGGQHAGDGTPITVQLDTSTAGLSQGSVTIGFTSTATTAGGGITTPVPSQTVNLSVGVYALAKVKFPKTTFYVDEKAGRTTQQFILPVDDLVDVYDYTEGLRATILSSTGDFTGNPGEASPTGTTGLIAAGQEDKTSLVFNAGVDPLDLAVEGKETGVFTIGLTSDGADTSKLGTTDLGTTTVTVTVDLPDKAKPQITSPAVFYIHARPSGTTTLYLKLGNYDYTDAAPLEDLTATITAATGDFTYPNPTASAVIADGVTDTTSFAFVASNVVDPTVPADEDVQTGAITFKYLSGTGAYQSALPSQKVPITVLFYQPAKPQYYDAPYYGPRSPVASTSLHYYIHAASAQAGGSTESLDIYTLNAAANDGSADNLISTITAVTGDFSHAVHSEVVDPTGETTRQIQAGYSDGTSLTFDAIDDTTLISAYGLQTQTGTFTLHQQSVPTDGSAQDYTLPDITLNVTVDVVAYALPEIEGVRDPVTNIDTPSAGVHPSRTIDLGTLLSGYVGEHQVTVANLATGNADSLIVSDTDEKILDPGQSDSSYTYYFGGDFAAGTYDDVVSYIPTSVNTTSADALTPVDITYVWHVIQPVVAAIGWGDVHLTTFDNVAYDFQGEGEFVLTRSTTPGNNFQVQERMTRFASSATVSVGREIAVQIGQDRITIDAQRASAVWLNGQAVAFDANNTVLTLAGGTVTDNAGAYTVLTNNGEQLSVNISDAGANGYLGFSLQLDTAHDAPGTVQGLLGQADNSGQEFRLADGSAAPLDAYGHITSTTLYGVYADAWRVTDSTSLLDYAAGQSTATFTDRNFPADATSLAQLPTSVSTQATQTVANAGITNPVIAQQAALDFALTGKISLISAAQNVQQLSSNVSAAVVTQDRPVVVTLGVTALATSQTETAGGTTTVTFQAYLSGPSPAGTSVSWLVTAPDGTYLAASAFGGTLPSGTVAIAAGLSQANFTVTLPSNILGTLPLSALQVTIASADGSSPVSAATAQTEIINSQAEPGAAAVPVFSLTGGIGNAVVANGTLALGTFVQGQTPGYASFKVANTASAPADDLSGALTGSDRSDFSLQLSTVDANGNFQPIKAGSSNQGVILVPNLATTGSFSDTLTFAPVDRNDSGYSQALATQTIVVTDTVIAPSAPVLSSPTSHAFGAVHVGDVATVALQIANAATSGAASLDVAVNVGSGGVVAHGAITGLAAGASDSGSITVGIDTSVVGVKSGLLQLVYASDAGGGQTLSAGTTTLVEQGSVWRLAAASVSGGPITGVVHVGDSVAGVITVANTDVADGYSEGLRASASASDAGISASGSTGLLAAGGSDASSLSYAVSTSASGLVSGSVAIALASDGAGTSGIGVTTLGTRSIAVNIAVDAHAVAALEQVSGPATLTGSGSSYTLDFGQLLIQPGIVSENLGVLNAAQGLADLLSGSLAVAGGSGFTLSGIGAFSGLGAGQADIAPTISLDTSTRGVFSETLTISASGSNASGFSEAFAPITLTIQGEVACFAAGTRIETAHGLSPVEALIAGDHVRTLSGALRPIRWIGSRRLVRPGAAHRPVRIAADCFGDGLPLRDLHLSPDHAVFAEGVLIPARALVDGEAVVSCAVEEVTYFHVELDTHDVILAEGLPCETYLDSDGYDRFDNRETVPAMLFADPCAPIETQGARVERVRQSVRQIVKAVLQSP